MNLEHVKEFLIEKEWSTDGIGFEGVPLYYKRFSTQTRCHCNDDKPGMQVTCTLWQLLQKDTVEFRLCGELANESWVAFKLYAVPDEIEEAIKQIPILIKAWEASNIEAEGEVQVNHDM